MSLGENLKKIREEVGFSLEDLAEKTKIQRKYLEYLENEEFDKLPMPVYIQGFIQKWCKACDVAYDKLLLQFYRENKQFANHSQQNNFLPVLSSSFIIDIKHIVSLLLIIFFILIFGYFYQNQKMLQKSPRIEILQPLEFSSVLEEEQILIIGEIENITNLFINGQEVFVNSQGIFEYTYTLNSGLNTILVSGKAKDGSNIETLRKVLKL